MPEYCTAGGAARQVGLRFPAMTFTDALHRKLDIAVKSAAVLALIVYAAKRDAELSQVAAAVNDLRGAVAALQGVSSDLARGVAVQQSRIDALERVR